MKYCVFFVLVFITLAARSQTEEDYVKLLTSDLRQTWILDSITLNSTYGFFKKETTVLFKLNNQAIIFFKSLNKVDTVNWFLERKTGYAMLRLGNAGNYEIDFLQKKNTSYLRLRDEIRPQKNVDVIEYFFTKSNL